MTTMTTHYEEREPLSIRPRLTEPPWRLSWGAVFAGTVLSLGLWLLLYVLGLGVGLTVIDPQNAGSLQGAGMTTGIWSLVVPLVAMFLGGLATAKVGGAMTRTAAVIHGGVVWALATLASILAFASLIGSLLGGAARLGASATATLGELTGTTPGGEQLMPIDSEEVVTLVNERLRATGKPTVTADQLRASMTEALRIAVRQGRFDREVIVQALATTTALSPQDARDIATSIEQRYGERASQARAAALQAAESTGRGLIGLFFTMLLGLLAAVAGTALGVTRGQRAVAERVNEGARRLAERHA